MEVRNLRLFLEVAATGSVLRAAAQLAVSPSSVSKAITTLERALSTRLFERTGRGVVLTNAGVALRPRAAAVVAAMDGLQDCLPPTGAPITGVVHLGIQPSVSWPLVADLLTQLGHSHPGIRLDVFEGTAHQIDEWLADGRVDIGLLSRRPSPAHADAQELLRLPLLLIGRTGSAETAEPTIAFARVARLPLLLANAPNGARLLLEELAARHGLVLNVVHNINSAHLKKQLVAHGGRFTVATAWTWASGDGVAALAASRIVDPEIALGFHLAVGGKRKPSEAVAVVTDMLRTLALAAAAQPGASWHPSLRPS